MSPSAAWSIPVLVIAVVVLVPHHLHAAEPFGLAITGAADASFAGTCTLTTATGDHNLELTGTVPLRRTIQADGLTCRLQTTGRIVVDIARGKSRSRSATNGGIVSVSVR